jgi:hypothetical protein
LDLLAHLRDQALGSFGQQLRERERGHRLHRGGEPHQQDQRYQEPDLAGHDHIVNDELGRGGQDQPADPVDQHEREAQC